MENKFQNKRADLLKLSKSEQTKMICDELVRIVVKKELHVDACPNDLFIRVMEMFGVQSFLVLGTRMSVGDDGAVNSARIEVFSGEPTTLIGQIALIQSNMLKRAQQKDEMRHALGEGLEGLRNMFEGK